MTDFVIRTKEGMIHFGDYDESFDTKTLREHSITCVVSEDDDLWVERHPFTGKEYDFDFSLIQEEIDTAIKNREDKLAKDAAEALGNDSTE